MAVARGSRLGPYDIVAPLGAGGMGEVWRGVDSRLDRSVAIKILPAQFSSDPARKLRFEREAKVISQLNHPNICALYDLGTDSGIDYLVMELIEGETLADRIGRAGALPFPDVIRFGSQIAEALYIAHSRGIVHRDLKPGNIMLTRSGAKLLDFGLARNAALSASRHGETDVMTDQKKPLTEEGTVVGTIQYMAPEQLGGGAVDHRSDIFALGAVLYEMAAGRRAFEGKNRTSIVAAIIAAEPPPLSDVQPLTPKSLDRLIHSCLRKEPDERMQSAHDVAVQLRWMSDAAEAAVLPVRRWLPWSIAALLALTTASALMYSTRGARDIATVATRFVITPPRNTNMIGIPALSPDGRRVVFIAKNVAGEAALWLRPLDSLEAEPLKGTEGATFAFWSPDGRQIGFTARGKLSRFDTADRTIQVIHEPVELLPAGATWNRDGVIVFAPFSSGQLMRIPASGGEPLPVAKGPEGETNVWPWFLPDGDHFLFRVSQTAASGIYVGSLSSSERKRIVPLSDVANGRVAYSAGHIVYNRGGVLYAQKFDADRLRIEGEARKLADGVEFYAPARAAFAVSESGTLVYHPASVPVVQQLMFVDRGGRSQAMVGEPASYTEFRLSPDDRRLAFTRWAETTSCWVLDIARGASTRISFERWSGFPVWMPDGRGIVYAAAVDHPPNLFLRRDNAPLERLTNTPIDNYASDVTPDGKFVISEMNSRAAHLDLIAVSVAAPHTITPLISTPFAERDAVISPDGKWLAYASDNAGAMQVYVTPFGSPGSGVQISTASGRAPRWSRDGRHLYYVDAQQKKLMEVAFTVTAGELQASPAHPLFDHASSDYDVTRDGRFLIATDQLNPDAAPMTVVTNWAAGLK